MYNRGDRARRGASGALWPTIRSSGVEFPAEASLFLAGALARGAEGWGPARRASRELRQDRKVAAVAGRSLVCGQPRWSRRPGTRRESAVGAGCTVLPVAREASGGAEIPGDTRRGFLLNIGIKVLAFAKRAEGQPTVAHIVSGGQKPAERLGAGFCEVS